MNENPVKESDEKNFMAAAMPGGIEAQEARGQRKLCESSALPKESSEDRKNYEALGIKFGKDIDDLFVEAQLPEGWKLEPSDHSMWSYVIDEKGKKRIAIFYKAAFYDRRARMRFTDEDENNQQEKKS